MRRIEAAMQDESDEPQEDQPGFPGRSRAVGLHDNGP